MHWIYILECREYGDGNRYYVGETMRLYNRLNEHYNGRGGKNTSFFTPKCVAGIYPLNRISKFVEYDDYVSRNTGFIKSDKLLYNFNNKDSYGCALTTENNIVECLYLKNKNYSICGGKYTNIESCICGYAFNNLTENDGIKNLPLCDCGIPCDVKKNDEHGYLYFRCAKKNIWNDMKEQFVIQGNPCKYFMKYTKDVEYRKKMKNIPNVPPKNKE